jgi:hypothetical protein
MHRCDAFGPQFVPLEMSVVLTSFLPAFGIAANLNNRLERDFSSMIDASQ